MTMTKLSTTHEELLRRALEVNAMNNGKIDVASETKQAEEPATPAFDIKELEGNTTFEDRFGKIPSGLKKQGFENFNIYAFSEEDWGEDAIFIPKTDSVRPVTEELYLTVLNIAVKNKIMLVGYSGTGKSTMVEYIAAKLKQPFYRVNGRRDMESDVILGKPWVENGATVWHLSDFAKAVQKGWMVLFDEPMKIPSGIMMTLQRYMERGGILQVDDMPGTLEDKQIMPHQHHTIIFADNVLGVGDNMDLFGSTVIQDTAFLNRIDVVIEIGYMDTKEEVNFLVKERGLSPVFAKQLVQLGNLIRKGYISRELAQTCSIRNYDSAIKMLKTGFSMPVAIRTAFVPRFPSEQQPVVASFIKTVFGF